MTANDSATPDTTALRRESKPKKSWNQVAMTISAKKPRRTDGIPASSSMIGLTISRVRGRAYCDTYSADATPSGTATAMATLVTFSVPMMSGHTPNFGISDTGCQIDAASSYPGQSCENQILASVTSFRIEALVSRGA